MSNWTGGLVAQMVQIWRAPNGNTLLIGAFGRSTARFRVGRRPDPELGPPRSSAESQNHPRVVGARPGPVTAGGPLDVGALHRGSAAAEAPAPWKPALAGPGAEFAGRPAAGAGRRPACTRLLWRIRLKFTD